MSQITISHLVELPEDLSEALKQYIDANPDWDKDRIFTVAIASFLMQQGAGDGVAAQYMEPIPDELKAIVAASEQKIDALRAAVGRMKLEAWANSVVFGWPPEGGS